jgi:hypothetical protein
MNDIIALIRRAILDYLDEAGGEHNDDIISMMLNGQGHRIARRDIVAQLGWLRDAGLIHAEDVGPFTVARIKADGRDVAAGRLKVDGVWAHKTGE